MRLNLVTIAPPRGIYRGTIPIRMCRLHPEAAIAFEEIRPWVSISDMFRSPESSLQAVREKRGAMPPGFSAHNFGLAIDIDVEDAIKKLGSKKTVDNAMLAAGWHCHRLDSKSGHEMWHYNFLGTDQGDGPAIPNLKNTAPLIERRILALYGHEFELTCEQIQQRLLLLKMYRGACDGKAGPLTREAVRIFQRAWGLPETGGADKRTQRTLAYVSV